MLASLTHTRRCRSGRRARRLSWTVVQSRATAASPNRSCVVTVCVCVWKEHWTGGGTYVFLCPSTIAPTSVSVCVFCVHNTILTTVLHIYACVCVCVHVCMCVCVCVCAGEPPPAHLRAPCRVRRLGLLAGILHGQQVPVRVAVVLQCWRSSLCC